MCVTDASEACSLKIDASKRVTFVRLVSDSQDACTHLHENK